MSSSAQASILPSAHVCVHVNTLRCFVGNVTACLMQAVWWNPFRSNHKCTIQPGLLNRIHLCIPHNHHRHRRHRHRHHHHLKSMVRNSWHTEAGIAFSELDTLRNMVQFPAEARDFSLLQRIQTGSETHLVPYSKSTGEGLLMGIKWPRCEAHLPLAPTLKINGFIAPLPPTPSLGHYLYLVLLHYQNLTGVSI
jgi:hypothetical protein